jgi:hypothetical protein
VRHSAANTLLRIIPHLVWPSPLDRSAPYKAILDYVREGFDVTNQVNQEGIHLLKALFFNPPKHKQETKNSNINNNKKN